MRGCCTLVINTSGAQIKAISAASPRLMKAILRKEERVCLVLCWLKRKGLASMQSGVRSLHTIRVLCGRSWPRQDQVSEAHQKVRH
eukprot:4945258-Amphidinium_carterae.1